MVQRFFASLVTAAFLFVSLSAQAEPQPEFSVTRNYVSLFFVAIPTSEAEKKATGEDERLVGNGSLVVISPKYALTVAHMFGDRRPAGTRIGAMRDNREIVFELVKKDEKIDLALITGDFRCPCVQIATKNPTVDESVYAVGFPLYGSYQLQMLTPGLIQGFSYENPALLVTTTTMAPGGSGGGIFAKRNDKYVLVGIISLIGTVPIGPKMLRIEQQLNWLTFSVPAEELQKFLKDVPLN